MINTLYLLFCQTRNYSVYKCQLNLNYIYALTLRRILIKAKFTSWKLKKTEVLLRNTQFKRAPWLYEAKYKENSNSNSFKYFEINMGVKCLVNDHLEIHYSRITSRHWRTDSLPTTQLAQLHNEELQSLILRCEKDLFSCLHSSLGLRRKTKLFKN